MTRKDSRGVALAVITTRIEAVIRKMVNTLYRTGRSGVINTANDFSCAIVTAGDELLASVESLPIHVMSGPDLMAASLREFHPRFAAGDAFLHNSPYHGNSHAADHTLLVPVVDADGVHRFTVVAKAHQADCGNALPTTYMPAASDVYEEGALIFPGVRIQRDYADCEDIVRMCRMRLRVPDQWWGDYLALVGAARVGERGLLALGEELGWDALERYVADWFDYSEARMAEAIRGLPEGSVSATSVLDPNPAAPDGLPITARVSVDPAEARVTVDLRDNPDCVPSGLNLTEATARTSAMIGVFNSLGPGIPPNAGSFRRLRVLLRENCVVGIPRHPTSCSLATTGVAERAANAVQAALAELGEGVGMAEAGYVMPPCDAVISGTDPRRGGERFINQIFFASSGGGGAPVEDGVLCLGHVGAAGVVRRDGVEMNELRFPIRIVAQRLLVDSEGAGRRRGSPGNYVEYGPVGTELRVIYSAGGSAHPAAGVRGGGPGSRSRAMLRARDGSVRELPADGDLVLRDGETVISLACGGGGYGPPHEREVERVAHDVSEGWISAERARQVYGVVFDADGNPGRHP
ncbi:hydantoinase B/oxoprolinase family protein [Pseudonocardia acaciae]|uniref:hydantoinase B/oxoprolinase family protein n=1 Tax=Pseudonocardia acaciae TaxID=551276 RepID=UPI000568BAA3|nr:hydantoinase B/oxoprolinase family protein [Pseudonocardia acaciae]